VLVLVLVLPLPLLPLLRSLVVVVVMMMLLPLLPLRLLLLLPLPLLLSLVVVVEVMMMLPPLLPLLSPRRRHRCRRRSQAAGLLGLLLRMCPSSGLRQTSDRPPCSAAPWGLVLLRACPAGASEAGARSRRGWGPAWAG
jgi:hypothetical protein